MAVTRRAVVAGLAGAGALVTGSAGVLRMAHAQRDRIHQDLGPLSKVLASIPANGVLYLPERRAYLVRYEPLPGQEAVNAGVAAGGLLALYQKCTHLGCRVVFCESSGWFECPCHGARFNRAGEYQFGPPPRGLDRLRLRVRRDLLGPKDHLYLDHFRLGEIIPGSPRGTRTIDNDPIGPHCAD